VFEPDVWNQGIITKVYNCFAYAFNIRDRIQEEKCKSTDKCYVPFHQPGSISGWPPINEKLSKTCPNIIGRIMGDNIMIVPSAFELKCPVNTSKIGLMVDPKQDYHFVRQDAPKRKKQHGKHKTNADIGYFSGKSGEFPVTNLDAEGHKIFDVELANFDYETVSDNLKYTEFCGYFCVSRKIVFAAVGGRRVTKRKSKNARRLSRKNVS
jgi:hypothetical protein